MMPFILISVVEKIKIIIHKKNKTLNDNNLKNNYIDKVIVIIMIQGTAKRKGKYVY